MLYDLSNPLQAESFKKRCNLLYKKKCIVGLTEKKTQRTLSQNSYLHAILSYFGMQFGYKMEEVKNWYFKSECNPDLFVMESTDKVTGKVRSVLKSTRDLSTDEMTTAIERFRNWAAEVAGIYIPSSEEHLLMEQVQIEVERGKYYL